MTDRELMQQALDALDKYGFMPMEDETGWQHFRKTIDALRARLAQPEQEPVWVEVTTNTGDKFILDSAVEADKIRAAKDAGLSVVSLYTAPPHFLDPAKVARLIDEAFERGKKEIDMEQVKDIAQKLADCAMLNSAPPQPAQQQEPVAWMHDSHVGFNVPLYTAPPQREWQGLTDEETREAAQVMNAEPLAEGWKELIKFASAVEAKLKEKNT